MIVHTHMADTINFETSYYLRKCRKQKTLLRKQKTFLMKDM